MNRNERIFCFLVLTLAALGGCSSEPPKKAGTALDRIQGKAQVLVESSGTTDAALNAGGASVLLNPCLFA
jgi:type IV pilus biogenesis protein CpaD/CtpE